MQGAALKECFDSTILDFFFFFWFSDFVILDQFIKRGFYEEKMIHIVGRHLASIGLWVSWWWFSLKCFELWLGIAVWCRFWVPICIIILFGGIDAIHYSYLDLWMSLTLALTFWFFNGFFKRLICTFLSLMDFIVATQYSHLSNRFYDFDLYIYIYLCIPSCGMFFFRESSNFYQIRLMS